MGEEKEIDFFDTMEMIDSYLFKEFNSHVGWWKELKFNKKGTEIDVMATDINGRKCHIELKNRGGRYKDFLSFCKHNHSIFIECGKIHAFSRIMQSGYSLNEQELVVNIFDDGRTFVIHNLNKPMTLQWLPNRRIYNRGTGKWEYEHRIGLPIEEADIYIYDDVNDTYKKMELPF